MSIFKSHQRQIHLDFHTSPFISDVGVDFDAEQFAETMEKASVNSVTVFAKCHHGQCYYPTKTGVSHPAIGDRDLVGEQIEALHKRGIRAPIYTTIVWEEDVAFKHPEWRQMTKEGHFAGWQVGPDGLPGHVATWQFNNYIDPDYQDYFEAHVREICERYGDAVDGFFFDILMMAPNAGWSVPSRNFRKKHGLLEDTQANFELLQGLSQTAFAEKFTKIVHGYRSEATVFYNSPNDGNMHPAIGPRGREAHQTHFEIESLPSGFWGYFHFPRMARAQSHWGKPWLGMTGRFQKMWGDFGGIKPQPALEFECFRAQAMGGASSVGDQLPPRGILDPAAYELIGSVYSQWEQAEPFYKGAELQLPKVGIFSPNYAAIDGGKSEEGAVLLCEEAKYDCAMIDWKNSLDGFELIILPDSTVVSPELADKVEEFYQNGGKLIISHKGGFDAEGNWALKFLPLEFAGEVEDFPTYWRAEAFFDQGMSESDRVFYQQGLNVKPSSSFKTLVNRVLPYFKRTAITYSSHFQTPPVSNADQHPAVVAGDRFVYCADPVFREYRQSGNLAVRKVWQKLMLDAVGRPEYGEGLPSNVNVYPMRRGDDLLLTLLHYVPVRKAMDIDVIDERSTFAGEVLKFQRQISVVKNFNSGKELEKLSEGEFALPSVKGRLLLEVPEYFKD